uniref:Ig-like domain-containing protein n=1 Tax=Crocodylus porosus TaxID=8502 RepID=A0A7M4ENV3_CROPO
MRYYLLQVPDKKIYRYCPQRAFLYPSWELGFPRLVTIPLPDRFVSVGVLLLPILDLTGTHEIEGVWKSSTILPCIYVPIEDFNQATVVWTLERDQTRVTIIQRDLSGDHTLLTQYRGRVSIQKEIPGNVSLQIKKLEIPDSGHYTCKVTWRAQNDSLITKEVTTTFRVVKGKYSGKTPCCMVGSIVSVVLMCWIVNSPFSWF